MRGAIAKLLQTGLVLLIVSVVAVWFLKAAPGDPVMRLLGSA